MEKQTKDIGCVDTCRNYDGHAPHCPDHGPDDIPDEFPGREEVMDIDNLTINADSAVVLSSMVEPGVRLIHYIYTPEHLRGEGRMRRVFSRAIRYANTRNETLILKLTPDDGMDKERLRKFYIAFGFYFGNVEHPDTGIRMVAE